MPAKQGRNVPRGKRVTRWLVPLLLVLIVLSGLGYYGRSYIGDFFAEPGAQATPGPSVKPSSSPTPPPLPLEPPPAKACVKTYCGKQLAYASIIVDTGQRRTTLPKRGWEVAVTTALTASGLRDLANETVPDSLNYPYDALSSNADAVGVFQLTPRWGRLSERMDPRYAAEAFYAKLKVVVTNREGWQDRSRVSTRELAQATHGSIYEVHYQDYEADAIAIVDFVLKYQFKPRDPLKEVFNDIRYGTDSGAVMFQCADRYSLKCEAVVWQLVQPILDIRAQRQRWFPKMLYQGDIGNKKHQDDNPPQDHTPSSGSISCYFNECNIRGWIYAQDLGEKGDINLPVFVRWLLVALRDGKYPCVKYVVTTHADNLKREDFEQFYGFFSRENNWVHEDHIADHVAHVHMSYMPGCERKHINILLDYHNWQLTL